MNYEQPALIEQLTTIKDKPVIQWQAPESLTSDLLPIPSFPTHILPAPLAAWIIDISERKDRAPIEYAAVAAMVALSSLLGRKAAICPKRHDDWQVIPNLWGVAIGRPSMKKTPCLMDALNPLTKMHNEGLKAHIENEKTYRAEQKLDQLQQKEADKRAAQLIRENKHADAMLLLEDSERGAPEPPVCKRYIVNDPSIEKLGEVLSENPMGVMLFRDEMSGFLKTIDKENHSEYRAFYLECWNGSGSYTYDRIGRGTVNIESTTLSLMGGMQPGKLIPYLLDQKNGKGDDGFIERLQMMVMPDKNNFEYVDRLPNQSAKQEAHEVFDNFNRIPAPEKGQMPLFHFDSEGQTLFENWYSSLMQRISQPETPPYLESHLSKYPSLMPSIALITHIAENGAASPVIEKEAAIKACQWCELLESHARRVYALADDPYKGAKALAGKLKLLPNPFRTADFMNKGWSDLKNAKQCQQALEILCKKHYLSRVEEKTATKRKALYYINPCLLDMRHPP